MRIACAGFALSLAACPALAQNVKITPVGSHPGELCANDRAIIFEDPTGVRFLYDAGPTVTGGNDPRLGTIHLVLLTHMHGDHVGNLKLKAPGEGTCANSARVPAPNSTTAEVVAAKNAVLVTTRAMAGFVHNKVAAIRGSGSSQWTFAPLWESRSRFRRRAARESTWEVFSPQRPRARPEAWNSRSFIPPTSMM
jgi:hypothetical protein